MLELRSEPLAAQPCIHLKRMALLVTEDRAPGPTGGGLLRAVGVVLGRYCVIEMQPLPQTDSCRQG
jgi:hypothetical protein